MYHLAHLSSVTRRTRPLPRFFWPAFLLLAFLNFALAAPSWAAKPSVKSGHVALVIGNGQYRSTNNLANSVRDARAIRDMFKKLGYKVIYGENLTNRSLQQKIAAFRLQARKMKVGAFYYAGHGLQMNGHNFIVPIDASFTRRSNLSDVLVSISDVINLLDRRAKVGLVFLDACRNQPFSTQIATGLTRGILKFDSDDGDTRAINPTLGTGLAKIDGEHGMLISYATRPGDVAYDGVTPHSPYTEGLLKYLPLQGLTINQVLARVRAHVLKATGGRQIPWDSSSLTADFYVKKGRRMRKEKKKRFVPPISIGIGAGGFSL